VILSPAELVASTASTAGPHLHLFVLLLRNSELVDFWNFNEFVAHVLVGRVIAFAGGYIDPLPSVLLDLQQIRVNLGDLVVGQEAHLLVLTVLAVACHRTGTRLNLQMERQDGLVRTMEAVLI